MPFQKGKSGNPSGRPPKSKALTDALHKALSKTVEVDGKKIGGKRFLARLVANILTNGYATFPDGTKLQIGPHDWIEFVKWVYGYLEPPAQKQDQTNFNVDLTSLSDEQLERLVNGEDIYTVLTIQSSSRDRAPEASENQTG